MGGDDGGGRTAGRDTRRASARGGAIRRAPGILVAILAVAGITATAASACVVGTGMVGSCTEAALNACLPTGGSFDGSVTFSCGGAATIVVTGAKVISSDTAIDGGGVVTLSGNNAVRVFSVDAGVTLSLDNLTVTAARMSDLDVRGGAIHNLGTLKVTNCTFSGNQSVGRFARGGAIYTNGTLEVTRCTFSGNQASASGSGSSVTWAFGGAIFTDGSGASTVVDSSFTGNSATAVGGIASAFGGAMHNNSGAASITGSTLANNAVSVSGTVSDQGDLGGAIYQIGSALTIANSTIVNNSVSGSVARGGGLYAVSTTATLTNCTVRQADTGLGASFYSTMAVVTLTNTIIAGAGDNCAAGPNTSFVDGGNNIDDGTSCGFTGTGCSNAMGSSFCNTDPGLDPAGLASNGGPTQTIALCNDGSPAGCTADSPAINAGKQSVCAAAPINDVDQRGVMRPGEFNPNCCIGAFEIGSLPVDTPTATPTETPTSTPSSTSTATATSTATVTSTGTSTSTPSSTATATDTPTPQPDGAPCDDALQCVSTFCDDAVCCDSACNGPLDRCNLAGRVGTCVNLAAPAPALDRLGLIAGALVLLAVAALALRRRA